MQFLNKVVFSFLSFFLLSVFFGNHLLFAMNEWPLSGRVGNDSLPLQPFGLKQMKSATVKSGNLTIVFTDNSELPPDHKKGYNGIAALYHSQQDSSVFVPAFSGLNLEHIFSGESPVSLFEPRKDPMALYQKNEKEFLLYQKPTTYSRIESLMEFKVTDEDAIDFTFHFVVHDEIFFQHKYAGIFFASYINQPPDRSIYFLGKREDDNRRKSSSLIRSYSEKHGEQSTHRAIQDNRDIYFAPGFTITLANHFSEFRYTTPFFYGRFHNMALAWFFEPSGQIRFSQSPDGAGPGNPAWDFYYLTTEPKAGVKYRFSGRMMYKPFKSEKNIAREYRKWQRKQ